MRECCRQSQAEVASNSSNKIHQTWGPPFSRALYIGNDRRPHTWPPHLPSFRIRVIYFPGIPSSSGLIIQDGAGRGSRRTKKRVPNWQSGNTRFSELVSNVRPHAYGGYRRLMEMWIVCQSCCNTFLTLNVVLVGSIP